MNLEQSSLRPRPPPVFGQALRLDCTCGIMSRKRPAANILNYCGPGKRSNMNDSDAVLSDEQLKDTEDGNEVSCGTGTDHDSECGSSHSTSLNM